MNELVQKVFFTVTALAIGWLGNGLTQGVRLDAHDKMIVEMRAEAAADRADRAALSKTVATVSAQMSLLLNRVDRGFDYPERQGR